VRKFKPSAIASCCAQVGDNLGYPVLGCAGEFQIEALLEDVLLGGDAVKKNDFRIDYRLFYSFLFPNRPC
jgi:hypothetical protein